MNKFVSIIALLLMLALIIFLKQDSNGIERVALTSNAKVLAFGDSLTYGKGASTQSYPTQLQNLINLEVINEGRSGEPSSKGLLRLPALLQEHKPSLVILCHGGNDLIHKKSKEILKANLIKMVRLSKDSGAQVLLVGVPNFKLVGFSTEALYEEVAEEEGLMYEGSILAKIENDSALKSDRIHPNANGYALMAKAFAEVLKENQLIK